MPTAATPRKRPGRQPRPSTADETSRLMRATPETYELVRRWAENEGRSMMQQLAVIVREWDKVTKGVEAEAKRRERDAKRIMREMKGLEETA